MEKRSWKLDTEADVEVSGGWWQEDWVQRRSMNGCFSLCGMWSAGKSVPDGSENGIRGDGGILGVSSCLSATDHFLQGRILGT